MKGKGGEGVNGGTGEVDVECVECGVKRAWDISGWTEGGEKGLFEIVWVEFADEVSLKRWGQAGVRED